MAVALDRTLHSLLQVHWSPFTRHGLFIDVQLNFAEVYCFSKHSIYGISWSLGSCISSYKSIFEILESCELGKKETRFIQFTSVVEVTGHYRSSGGYHTQLPLFTGSSQTFRVHKISRAAAFTGALLHLLIQYSHDLDVAP